MSLGSWTVYSVCSGENAGTRVAPPVARTVSVSRLGLVEAANAAPARTTADSRPAKNFFIFRSHLSLQNRMLPRRLRHLRGRVLQFPGSGTGRPQVLVLLDLA